MALSITECMISQKQKKQLFFALDQLKALPFHEAITKVILYGSVARNKANDRSVMELLVLVETDEVISIYKNDILSLQGYSDDVDYHFLTEESYLNQNTAYIQGIRDDGIELYAKRLKNIQNEDVISVSSALIEYQVRR